MGQFDGIEAVLDNLKHHSKFILGKHLITISMKKTFILHYFMCGSIYKNNGISINKRKTQMKYWC